MNTPVERTARERLPDRRLSETFTFVCVGDHLTYTATVSRFPDGRVAEIFLANHKGDSHAGHAARDAAILASLALKFGAPLETLRNALLRDHQGRAVTAVGAALDRLAEGRGR